MANPKRKPRIRKTPTVRQQIEESTKETIEQSPSRGGVTRILLRPIKLIFRFLGVILRPLAPMGRRVLRILKWLVPSYFIKAWRELKQVTWPNRRETWRLTSAVFIFAVVFGTLVAVVDKGLDEVFKRLVLR